MGLGPSREDDVVQKFVRTCTEQVLNNHIDRLNNIAAEYADPSGLRLTFTYHPIPPHETHPNKTKPPKFLAAARVAVRKVCAPPSALSTTTSASCVSSSSPCGTSPPAFSFTPVPEASLSATHTTTTTATTTPPPPTRTAARATPTPPTTSTPPPPAATTTTPTPAASPAPLSPLAATPSAGSPPSASGPRAKPPQASSVYYILTLWNFYVLFYRIRCFVASNPHARAASFLRTDSDQNECIVCMERIPNISLTCGHCFCSSCAEHWADLAKTCPLCRQPMGDITEDSWDIVEAPPSRDLSGEFMELFDGLLRQAGYS